MPQLVIKIETIRRVEEITGKHIIRGGDKIINEALDILEKKVEDGKRQQK